MTTTQQLPLRLLAAIVSLTLIGCDDTPAPTNVAQDAADTAAETLGADSSVADVAVEKDTTPSDVASETDAISAETLQDVGVPDAAPEVDAAEPDTAQPDVSASCPPVGPFGHGQGDTLTNYTLTTCDGQPYDVHQLCGANAGLIFNYYGWCPPCQTFAAASDALYKARQANGFKMLFVVAQKSNSTAPDATYCQQVKDNFGLTMDVVYDPNGVMTAYGTNDSFLVSNEAGVIVWKEKYPSSSAVTAAIDAELAQ